MNPTWHACGNVGASQPLQLPSASSNPLYANVDWEHPAITSIRRDPTLFEAHLAKHHPALFLRHLLVMMKESRSYCYDPPAYLRQRLGGSPEIRALMEYDRSNSSDTPYAGATPQLGFGSPEYTADVYRTLANPTAPVIASFSPAYTPSYAASTPEYNGATYVSTGPTSPSYTQARSADAGTAASSPAYNRHAPATPGYNPGLSAPTSPSYRSTRSPSYVNNPMESDVDVAYSPTSPQYFNPSQYSPASPQYSPEQYSPTSPSYSPAQGGNEYSPTSPSYGRTYSPSSPDYSPTYNNNPATYSPTSPSWSPSSPSYSPASPSWSPSSPSYSPASPSYSPASPSYSPASPTWTPTSPSQSRPASPARSDGSDSPSSPRDQQQEGQRLQMVTVG